MNRKTVDKGTLELINERAKVQETIERSTSSYLRSDLSKRLKEIDEELKRRR